MIYLFVQLFSPLLCYCCCCCCPIMQLLFFSWCLWIFNRLASGPLLCLKWQAFLSDISSVFFSCLDPIKISSSVFHNTRRYIPKNYSWTDCLIQITFRNNYNLYFSISFYLFVNFYFLISPFMDGKDLEGKIQISLSNRKIDKRNWFNS